VGRRHEDRGRVKGREGGWEERGERAEGGREGRDDVKGEGKGWEGEGVGDGRERGE